VSLEKYTKKRNLFLTVDKPDEIQITEWRGGWWQGRFGQFDPQGV
jgi:hypothetical protein